MRTFKGRDQEQPEPRPRGHFCPIEFEREYLAQYELRDQVQLRRRTLAEVGVVMRTHGEPETAGLMAGPPKDWPEALERAKAHAQMNRDAMDAVRKVQ